MLNQTYVVHACPGSSTLYIIVYVNCDLLVVPILEKWGEGGVLFDQVENC